jgi:hypothetical protein
MRFNESFNLPLRRRTTPRKLVNIAYLAASFLAGVLVSWALLSSAAQTQANRIARLQATRAVVATIAAYQLQLAKCHTGQFCRVDGYQFLTVAEKPGAKPIPKRKGVRTVQQQ